MGRLAKRVLLDRVATALQESGWNYLLGSTSHPFEISALRGETVLKLRVYVWNITHGGGAARAPNEFRIQITSGVDQFDTAGVDRTLVLGWWEEAGVFAGFDVSKHREPLGASPSFQILEDTLRRAVIDRIATQPKANDEIAIAFTPSFMGEYVEQMPVLHGIAQSPADLAVLNQVIADPTSAEAFVAQQPAGPRRSVLVQVARQLRDASFKDRVLTAYRCKCGMCGTQLRLVEAAHIVPAAHSNNDATSNGILLCVLHHRAFDRALITVTDKYRIVLNPCQLLDLEGQKLDGGLGTFKKNLRPILDIPADKRDRPDPALIREANRLRGWKSFQEVA